MLKSAAAPRTPVSLSVRGIVSEVLREMLLSIFIAIASTQFLFLYFEYDDIIHRLLLYPEQTAKSKESAPSCAVKLTLPSYFVILI